MINKALISPRHIVVIGGSNSIMKPGGKIVKNILDHGYKGRLFIVNPKESEVQGIKSYSDVHDIPEADLAIFAIPAKLCPPAVKVLTTEKQTRAFIVLSAGFSEESREGANLEHEMVDMINKVNGCLIGPNCIGYINPNYAGAFTTPIPKLDTMGCDFISGSGATAVFIMEAGIPKGLTFASVYSVGNSAQMGVEDVLKYMDESFNPVSSSKVKLLYLESILKPDLLLKHASSLIRKGCKIAAIKAGASEAGSRAASSHTGAMASPDTAVDALFRKAGIVRCYSREELTTVASVFMHKKLTGKNMAIITHAGGPAVMLTDTLSQGGLSVPHIEGEAAHELLKHLYPGSSVANPIDFLATGNAEQLGRIIDYCETRFNHIDAMIVIFGSPGLFDVYDVYRMLDEKMKTCSKPVFPVLPSIINAEKEITDFLSKGRLTFSDEAVLGKALSKVFYAPKPAAEKITLPRIDEAGIRKIIDSSPDGYLPPEKVQLLLDAAGISRVSEKVVNSPDEAVRFASETGYPVVMKVVGPVHKTDVGGVTLNIKDNDTVLLQFTRMMKIAGATGVLIQPMISGIELFAGAKQETLFGHMILCGLGGIMVEVLKDVSSGLAPLSEDEALAMIRSLKGYKIIQGVRGREGTDEKLFAGIITRLSALVTVAPEISELDINPLLGAKDKIVAVDARIHIKKMQG